MVQFPGPLCPGLVACNVLQSKSLDPLCGTVWRGWGDFIDRDQLVFGASNNNKWPGQFPLPLPPADRSPPPGFGAYTGLATCGLCVDIVNSMNFLFAHNHEISTASFAMAAQEYDEALQRQHAADLGVAGSDAALAKDSEMAQKLFEQQERRRVTVSSSSSS